MLELLDIRFAEAGDWGEAVVYEQERRAKLSELQSRKREERAEADRIKKEENQKLADELNRARQEQVRRAQRTRDWRDITGQFSVRAEFRSMSNGKVRLLRVGDQQELIVSIDKLSLEDQEWLRSLAR